MQVLAMSEKPMSEQETARPSIPEVLSLLALRDTVLFPQAVLPLAVARKPSVQLVDEAIRGSHLIGAVTQRDPQMEEPGADDLYGVGTTAMIHKVLRYPDGTIHLIVQGLARFRIVEVTQRTPFLKARVEILEEVVPKGDLETEALARSAQSLFQKIVELSPTLSDELAAMVMGVQDPGRIADFIATTSPSLPTPLKQDLLERLNVKARLETLTGALAKEVEVLELGTKIQSQVHSEMSKSQREYYLREQMKAIQ